jgi:hypothetical protein
MIPDQIVEGLSAYKGLVQQNSQASSKAHMAFTFTGCLIINYSI